MNLIEQYISSDTEEIFCSYRANGTPRAHVIILTGDGQNGTKSSTWVPLTEGILKEGFGVLLFDFVGQGLSRGNRKSLNISVGIRNFRDAFLFFNQVTKIEKLAAIGSSFGGAVLLNTDELIGRFDTIVFKSPASDLLETYECEHKSGDDMDQWKIDMVSHRNGLRFKAYQEAAKYNSYHNCDKIKCPVTIIHGLADDVVPIKYSRRLQFLIGDNCRLIELEGVEHDYKQNGALDKFVDLTIQALKEGLLG